LATSPPSCPNPVKASVQLDIHPVRRRLTVPLGHKARPSNRLRTLVTKPKRIHIARIAVVAHSDTVDDCAGARIGQRERATRRVPIPSGRDVCRDARRVDVVDTGKWRLRLVVQSVACLVVEEKVPSQVRDAGVGDRGGNIGQGEVAEL